MTTLAHYTWRLIADPKLSPDDRYAAAWNLWRDAGADAIWASSRFASICLIASLNARETETLYLPVDPDAVDTAPLGERAEEVVAVTWNHLNGLVTAFDIDAEDPSSEDELATIAARYKGDAGYMFNYWGHGAIADFNTVDRSGFETRYQWVRRQIELLADVEL